MNNIIGNPEFYSDWEADNKRELEGEFCEKRMDFTKFKKAKFKEYLEDLKIKHC